MKEIKKAVKNHIVCHINCRCYTKKLLNKVHLNHGIEPTAKNCGGIQLEEHSKLQHLKVSFYVN